MQYFPVYYKQYRKHIYALLAIIPSNFLSVSHHIYFQKLCYG